MSQCQVHSSRAMRQRGQPGRHTMVDGAGAETIPQAHSPKPLNGLAECLQSAIPPPLTKRCKIFREKQRKLVPISWPHASRAHLMAFFVSERLNFGLYVENGAMENLNAAISIARRHLSVLKGRRPSSWHHSHSPIMTTARILLCALGAMAALSVAQVRTRLHSPHSTRCKNGRRKVTDVSVLTSRASWALALPVLVAWVRAVA